jgi:anti-sigma factor RsiW
MACGEFELSGLLYVSGELSTAEARAYEAHLGGCEECQREIEEYRKEHATLYTAEVLGAYPSGAVDSEILRVCANPKKMHATALTPMLFLRKYAPVPVLLVLIAVAVGGYVRYHSIRAESLRAKLITETPAASVAAGTEILTTAADEDAALEGGPVDSGGAVRPMGNLNMEGVVTVSGGE